MNIRQARSQRAFLAAVLFLLVMVATGCSRGPQRVSLADLAAEPERYHGQAVETAGVVIEFGPEQGALSRHYVVQDAEANRVELEPEEAVSPHVGATVRVIGPFEYSETTGRILHIDTIEPAAGAD
jgi:hypothetical protein